MTAGMILYGYKHLAIVVVGDLNLPKFDTCGCFPICLIFYYIQYTLKETDLIKQDVLQAWLATRSTVSKIKSIESVLETNKTL